MKKIKILIAVVLVAGAAGFTYLIKFLKDIPDIFELDGEDD